MEYEKPEVNVIEISIIDIITTSEIPNDGADESTGGGLGMEDLAKIKGPLV